VKVLFVCPWIPWPLTNGGKIRTFHLVREAARRAEVHLRLVREPDTDPDAVDELSRICASVKLFDRTPPDAWMRWSRAKLERWFHSVPLRDELRRELARESFDVVHLDELLLARLVPADCRAAVVQHHHKLDTVLYGAIGIGGRFDRAKLRRLEAYSARRFRHQLLCSEDDAAILRRRYGELRFGVLPSGYDPSTFAPSDPPRPRDPARLLFLGSMDYGPNVDGIRWFAAKCWPEIRARRPDAHLEVVGGDPTPEVRALASAEIEVTGRVPAVRPHLERAGVFVVPLRIGGGTRLKIVEALSLATPTVSTTIGAEGLGLVDDEHLLLADDPASFAAAVIRLIEDREAATRLGETGRSFAAARYRWETLADRLVDYWERAASSSG